MTYVMVRVRKDGKGYFGQVFYGDDQLELANRVLAYGRGGLVCSCSGEGETRQEAYENALQKAKTYCQEEKGIDPDEITWPL